MCGNLGGQYHIIGRAKSNTSLTPDPCSTIDNLDEGVLLLYARAHGVLRSCHTVLLRTNPGSLRTTRHTEKQEPAPSTFILGTQEKPHQDVGKPNPGFKYHRIWHPDGHLFPAPSRTTRSSPTRPSVYCQNTRQSHRNQAFRPGSRWNQEESPLDEIFCTTGLRRGICRFTFKC